MYMNEESFTFHVTCLVYKCVVYEIPATKLVEPNVFRALALNNLF